MRGSTGRWLALALVLLAPAGAEAQEGGLAPVPKVDVRGRAAPTVREERFRLEHPREEAGPTQEALVMADRSRVGVEAVQQALRLQPRLHFGGIAKGLRGAWDGGERIPPTAMRIYEGWEIAAHSRAMAEWSGGTLLEGDPAQWFVRRGAVFYHDLPEPGPEPALLHRFVYFFPGGSDWLGRVLGPHFVWVELRTLLAPTDAQRARWQARARAELEARGRSLAEMVASETDPQARAAIQGMAKQVEGMLAAGDEVAIPEHFQVSEVVVTDPIPVEGGPVTLKVYAGDALQWEGARPKLWVTEGDHHFLPDPAMKTFWQECDPPYTVEPRDGRVALIDLREFRQPENPLAARAAGQRVQPMPGFLEHPALLLGWRGVARRHPELLVGKPFGEVRVLGPAPVTQAVTAPARAEAN